MKDSWEKYSRRKRNDSKGYLRNYKPFNYERNSVLSGEESEVKEEIEVVIPVYGSCVTITDEEIIYIGDEMAKPKLGSGARFKAVEKDAAKSGARNPAAVAAAAGMAKYGKVKMEKMAVAGKKKS